VVPEGAVQASAMRCGRYVVERGNARLRPIQIGLRTGTGRVEVASGRKAGDVVVVERSDRRADGLPVQPAAAPSPAADPKGAPAPGGRAAGDPK